MNVDLNADLGEGAGTDEALMPLITSANVCCGVHAGDEATSRRTLEFAKSHGVRVGAHPGYADREHFGRRELQLPIHELHDLIRTQVESLDLWAGEIGLCIAYIKPHGALYNQAMRNLELAGCASDVPNNNPIALTLRAIASEFVYPLMGLPDSELEHLSKFFPGFIREGFADRRYRPDGTLVPRSEPNAILHDAKEVVEQVDWLIRDRGVQSICVHGDSPGAVEFVRKIREMMG